MCFDEPHNTLYSATRLTCDFVGGERVGGWVVERGVCVWLPVHPFGIFSC